MNAYRHFQSAPQIYNISAPLGGWRSDFLAYSGIGRGHHNRALLVASAEVLTACRLNLP